MDKKTDSVPLQKGEPQSSVEVRSLKEKFKKTEQELVQSNHLLKAITKAQSQFISNVDTRVLFSEMLNNLLSLTQSEYGFIGEVLYDPDSAPYLKSHAVTNIAWNEETRALYDKHAATGLEFRNLKSLFGTVLSTGKEVISNRPSTDPRRCGIPEGHPPLNAFLGLPFYQGEQMLGMVGIANRPEGYGPELVDYLQPFLSTCANIIQAHKIDKKRNRAEEDLKKSEASLANAQRIAMLGNWEWDIAADNLRWSDQVYRIFEIDPRQFGASYNAFLELVHPEDREFVKGAVNKALERKKEYSIDHRVLLHNGQVKIVHEQGEIICSAEGIPQAMVGTVQDITSKKREEELRTASIELEKKVEERTRELVDANEALRDSQERLRGLIETTSDWVWEVDAKGIYTYVSPKIKDLLGYEPEEILGRTWFDLMSPGEVKNIHEKFIEIVASKEPFALLENRSLHKDGSIVVLETSGMPILDADGNLLGYRGIDRDVTARKIQEQENERMQKQLLQSQKMESIGVLAGGIAHDFNNLMVIIKLNSNLALEKASPESIDFLQQINMASERAEALTRQLLIFSRRQPTEIRPLNLNQLLFDTLTLLNRIIGENIQIKTDLAPAVNLIMADRGNIEQMIMNLLLNAKDAMPRGGVITIRTESLEVADKELVKRCSEMETGSYVRLSIQDTGMGMDAETLRQIFEPFFTTKGLTGTGLGLAVVQSIIKDLKGWIDVDTRPGAGTRFELYFPATDHVEKAQEMELDLSAPGGRGERILLVEDEKFLRKSIAIVLSKNRYTVFEAASVKEALAIFKREQGRFDLVMTDVMLHDRTGLELVEELKTINIGSFNVLITSGYFDVESQWPAISQHGYSFLQKPYEATDLLRCIGDVFRAEKKKKRQKSN